MKKDIITIVIITISSVLVASLLMGLFLDDPAKKTAEVNITDTITNDFSEPDTEIFNEKAINPTVKIVIGNENAEVIGE